MGNTFKAQILQHTILLSARAVATKHNCCNTHAFGIHSYVIIYLSFCHTQQIKFLQRTSCAVKFYFRFNSDAHTAFLIESEKKQQRIVCIGTVNGSGCVRRISIVLLL